LQAEPQAALLEMSRRQVRLFLILRLLRIVARTIKSTNDNRQFNQICVAESLITAMQQALQQFSPSNS
jgi:hypothetical protein